MFRIRHLFRFKRPPDLGGVQRAEDHRQVMAALRLIHQAQEKLTLMAKTLDDILAAQAATLDKITAMKTVDDGIAALVTSQKQTMTDLKAQLDAAITANDPAKMQAVADNMDKINAAIDATTAADAVVAGTTAAPAA